MSVVIQCVPNFSEGRDKKVIEQIGDAVLKTNGATLLNVDPGESTNRTVYTFVGDAESVVEAAFNAAVIAHKLIDMTKHKGTHPRMGAMDVCPFVPVSGATEEDCIRCAKQLSKKLSDHLQIPIYLYGAAASCPERKAVPQIRAGEYEGLQQKLSDPSWKPDFGPAQFVPTWGASIVGVRKFLIAYNINLIATKEQAHRIALNVRSGGRGPGSEGRLRAVQGMGWWLDEANMAQVSLNLTDIDVTPVHVAFEEVCKDAEELQLPVVGSEVVGLLPLRCLLEAAEYFIQKEGLFVLDEDQKIRLAVNRLGLSALAHFDPKERVIEYRLGSGPGRLANLSSAELVKTIAARSPAPGGGSVVALVGAMGAALGAMAGQMTYGKRQWEHLDAEMRKIIPVAFKASQKCVELIDKDSDAFDAYMAAMKLPKTSPEEQIERQKAMDRAMRNAIDIPFGLMKLLSELWDPLKILAQVFNLSTASDLQVGVRCLDAAIGGAHDIVMLNLMDLKDEDLSNIAKSLVETSKKNAAEILDFIAKRLTN